MTRACFSATWSLLIAGAVLVAQPAYALFHLAHIAEVNARAGDDPGDQYVEIVMEFAGQTHVKNSVLGAFDCSGTYLGDLLIVPDNLANGGSGVRWIMATLNGTGGIVPDFLIPNGAPAIPGDCGQVCWGAPGGVQPPPDPDTWSRTDLNNFVDCVSWGPYTGPTRAGSGPPSPFTPGDGTFSLERVNDTTLTPACPSPENNAGTVGSYGFCPEPTTTSTLFGTSTSTTLFGTTTTTSIPPTSAQRLGGGLLLSTRKNPAKQKLGLRSIQALGDEVTLGSGPGSADDPTLHGGSLAVFSSVAGAFVNTYPLDASTGTWAPKRRKGLQVGWVFTGAGPITNVTIIESNHVSAKGKGALGLELGVDPRPVGVLLDIGTHRYCLQFGKLAFFKANRRFRAPKNPAPEVCPMPPD